MRTFSYPIRDIELDPDPNHILAKHVEPTVTEKKQVCGDTHGLVSDTVSRQPARDEDVGHSRGLSQWVMDADRWSHRDALVLTALADGWLS